MAVDDGALGQDVDLQSVGHGDDLRRHLDLDFDDALLDLRRDRKVNFDFVVGANKDLKVEKKSLVETRTRSYKQNSRVE